MAVIRNSNPIIFGTSSADTITADYDGADLFGLGGNDDYYVNAFYSFGDVINGGSGKPDILADTVHEEVGGGIDTVYVELFATPDGATNGAIYGSLDYSLGDNVENLVAELSGDYNYSLGHDFYLFGNDLSNTITASTELSSYAAIIFAAGGNDTLAGSLGDDTLYGGAGIDSMKGGAGSDKYEVDSVLDKVIEAANEGYDRVYSTVSFTLGLNVEGLILTGGISNGTGNALNNQISGTDDINTLNGLAGDDYLLGGVGNDTLNGGVGNDTLYGGLGIDKMDGGAGDDLYQTVEAGDIITDTGAGGNDTIETSEQRIGDLSVGIENLTLTGSGGISGRGNALNNTLLGNSGNNLLEGLSGNDLLNGAAGNDILNGGDGADLLDGGTGADLMMGGNGNDTYIVDDSSDAAVETNAVIASGGTDSVFSSVTFALGANLENLTLVGSSGNGYGNAGKNFITGNSLDNDLWAFGGDDTLDGGAGADSMHGGDGNDTFIVDNSSDWVSELVGPASYGTADLVKSSAASFNMNIMAVGVENLTLTGSGSINGYGNSLNNLIIGNSGNNILTGYGGNDTLQGGAGNDIYFVDTALDKVIETANAGIDAVYSSVTFSLALLTNVENLTLTDAAANGTGNTLNNFINGNANSNLLIGNAGNDTLRGGNNTGEMDTLNGGAGNDTYFVDNVSDVIIDSAGIDSVVAIGMSSYTLGTGLENLSISFAAASTGIGNELNNLITGDNHSNTLYGANGNDTLDGGGGIDTMWGDIGNDTFIVDNAGDIVRDVFGGGTDLVKSSVDFSLDNADGANIENLTLTGSGHITGFGNALANIITGNEGNNSVIGGDGNDTLIGGLGDDGLSGGTGNDSMTGGAGNDSYYVDSAGDKVIELAGGGTDTVFVYSNSIISYTLGANVENLTLQGSNTINGTGNALNNIMYGNSGVNVLNGAGGNDTLKASDGNDTLTGGTGEDVFNFDSVHLDHGVNRITDFASGVDSLELTGFGLSFTGAGGSLDASQFHIGTAAGDADDRIIFDNNTGALYYDIDGNNIDMPQHQIFSFTNFASPGFTVAATDIFG